MILNSKDTLYAYEKLKQAYGSLNRIDDYFRMKKIDRINSIPSTLFGLTHEEELFQDFSIHPKDMNFRIVKPDHFKFNTLLELTASFTYEDAPGKEMKLMIVETNTNTVVGFIKLGSPIINSKPRNDWLGGVPDLNIFNKRAIMRFIIVPAQPFGFNYIGGKLMSLICCSHEVREMLNQKYNTEMCLFETTSLYGSLKSSSQYDGMKPFLRYRGDTESKFLLNLPDSIYHDFNKWFCEKNGGELVHKGASSRKMKIQNKMVSIIKNSIKENYPDKLQEFDGFIQSRKDITTKKRFYMSDYGYSNVRDVLLGKTDRLEKNKENYDKFYLENMLNWWRNKASNRYENLVKENSIRKELEVWNEETMNTIDIIR